MSTSKSIKVFAPATVANVACGFDVLGFAVDQPGDEVLVRLTDQPGVKIELITGDDGQLPLDPEQNTVTIPIIRFLEKIQSKQGVSIQLHKKVPFSGGMGSSSASAVAGVFGVNHLLGNPLDVKELLPFAIEGERVACGTAHADNVAPALLGGFVIVRGYNPVDAIKISSPENLYCTLVHPDVKVRTEDARKILPTQILLTQAVKQWGNVAGLVAGLMQSDYDLIKRSLKDEIIEPARAALIPGFLDVKQAAIEAGALGCSISGSGPSVFALSNSEELANSIGKSMQEAFTVHAVQSQLFVSKINQQGPKIID